MTRFYRVMGNFGVVGGLFQKASYPFMSFKQTFYYKMESKTMKERFKPYFLKFLKDIKVG